MAAKEILLEGRVPGQPKFESKDCQPQKKGVVLRIVADCCWSH
jgi:hypothetical protein